MPRARRRWSSIVWLSRLRAATDVVNGYRLSRIATVCGDKPQFFLNRVKSLLSTEFFRETLSFVIGEGRRLSGAYVPLRNSVAVVR